MPLQVPDDALYEMAKRAIDGQQYALAAPLLETFLHQNADHANAHYNLGYSRFFGGDYQRALLPFARAVELRPRNVRFLVMYATVLFLLGRRDEALAIHRRVLRSSPEERLDRVAASAVRLMHGEYERGWQDWEQRWEEVRLTNIPFRPHQLPLWDGSPIPDRTLCIHPEGGFGDILMFSRFIPLVAEKAGRLEVRLPRTLHRILASMPGVDLIAEHTEEPPEDALHTSFWSLPAHLGVTLESLPSTVPYLRPPESGPTLEPGTGFRVGLTWAGNPRTTHDRDRSVPSLELLAPLFELPGIEWVSLQIGSRAEEADGFPLRTVPEITDFADTAHVITQLDLVISVDTAIVHLAGAMAQPIWIIVPAMPEFRWLLGREDSPWYPTARLFRKSDTTDWEGVVERLRNALIELGSSNSGTAGSDS
jgi:hypothetical protein